MTVWWLVASLLVGCSTSPSSDATDGEAGAPGMDHPALDVPAVLPMDRAATDARPDARTPDRGAPEDTVAPIDDAMDVPIEEDSPPPWGPLPGDGFALPPRGPRPTAITCGLLYACARMSDATVRCWGTDLPTAPPMAPPSICHDRSSVDIPFDCYQQATPIVSLQHVSQIDVSLGAVVRTDDGAVYRFSWRENPPVRIEGLSDVVDIANSMTHACAVHSNGTLDCWGDNEFGQLGVGDIAHHAGVVHVPIDHVTHVRAGSDQTCALRDDGSVMCWGVEELVGDGQSYHPMCAPLGGPYFYCASAPTPAYLPRAVAIVAGGASCALLDTAQVYCWGFGGGGYGDSLGRSESCDGRRCSTPLPVYGLGGVVSLSHGGGHACAVRRDGSVWCWGINDRGQVGDGTTVDRFTAAPIAGLRDIVQVSCGSNFSCALRNDGAVLCWGYNEFGQLGDGTTIDRLTPTGVLWAEAPTPAGDGGADDSPTDAVSTDLR